MQMGDCILGASECFYSLSNSIFGGHVALKIDICKTFDSISCSFVLEDFRFFGFSTIFTASVSAIFSFAHISVLLYGASYGYFSCSCGIKQCNPLSLLLFCLVEDFFSCYFAHLFSVIVKIWILGR
ncbi:hypothetical protein PanWU01x14_300750 [Parasponia andersonii]|uniref:Uncharacterized protein n=1 Tax=Parasponia andersonii TaxID=3476 RepID=A0A2P5ATX7_PARAD|nr:hypothetical protein PanWU01x14_300750 [Parasponia andersonii]